MTNYTRLILFFSGALLCSCGQGNNHQPADTVKHSDTANIQGIAAYQKYITTLDTTNAGTATLAAQKYKELFSNNDTLTNDRGYTIFEECYTRLLFGLNNHFESDKTINKVPSALKVDDPSTYPPALAKYAEDLKINGFEFIEVEGSLEISEDRDFIAKWFYPSVSGTMKKYLEQINKENKAGLEEDDALIISTIELSDRAIWWENFTVSYPHFIAINEAMRQKELYLTILLRGLNNSPILNYDSHNLTEFYKAAYEHLISKYPDAAATKMVKPFYEALKVKDVAKTKQIISQYEAQKLLLW